MEREQEFVFRPATPADRHFIESSWASSYYAACRIKDILSPDDFHAYHRPLRERFFARQGATVLVCAAASDPDVILGWIATESVPNATVIHYVYVKSHYRRDYGIFGMLVERAAPQGEVLYTHFTPKAAAIMGRHPGRFQRFRFQPHLT